MIRKIYESYDDNNYYIDVNKKKLAHDNLAVVGGMLTFFLIISIFFVAMAMAFGEGVSAYIKYFPAIGVLAILLIIYMQIFRKKDYDFKVTRVFCLLFYAAVILAFSIADSFIYTQSRAVFFPVSVILFSMLYMDYFWVLFLYKAAVAVIFLFADSYIKSGMVIVNDITVAILAIIASTFGYSILISMTLSRREDSEQLVQKSQTDLLTGLLSAAPWPC